MHSGKRREQKQCFSRLFHFSFSHPKHSRVTFQSISVSIFAERTVSLCTSSAFTFECEPTFGRLQPPAACKLSSCLISFTIYVDVTLFRRFPPERTVSISAHVAPATREEINDPFARTASAQFQRLPPERLPPSRSPALTFPDFHFNGSAAR